LHKDFGKGISGMFWQKYLTCLLFVVLSIFVASSSHGEEEEAVILTLDRLDLLDISYPWWKELYLNTSGYVDTICENAVLTFSLFYLEQRVTWFDLVIPPNSSTTNSPYLFFEKQWGPINTASQQILAGEYKITVDILWQNQSQSFHQKWNRLFPGKKPAGTARSFTLGSEQDFAQDTEHWQEFYIARMLKLNGLFKELQTQKQEALQIRYSRRPSSENAFAEGGRFSSAKWEQWLQQIFYPKVVVEQKILKQSVRQTFPQRYPVTHTNMEAYANVLFRLSRTASMELYEAYQLFQNKEEVHALDPGAIENFSAIVHYIQQLHVGSAEEMKINLRKKLGYLPPPGTHY
jgi:uncharacterized protein YqcC (DUF446 family)